MQANNPGFISARASSVTALAQPQDPHDVIDDDRCIARELLNLAPHDKQSLSRESISLQGFDGSQPQRSDVPRDDYKNGRLRRTAHTSNTWTSSDGDIPSDQDEIDDRTVFVEEYNRLAIKHGIRIIKGDYEQCKDECNYLSTKPGWFRRILKRTSSSQSLKSRPDRHKKHSRSISDLSLRLKIKKDKLKDKDLQELVRLCGASILYLPAEYAAGSLLVPTCFRATAQYLIQYGISTRGIFRIPGSHNIVAALYNHYCSMDEYGQAIAGTVRCPSLPDHIKCDVHDVASAFKKFLSGLPGGILGSLSLLDAFISIQSQLAGQAELTRTKQSKVRARLIALAIATLRSQYRRALICAVFGLLCMIGRTSETAKREDPRGRPLPTSDLMGYGPLGIVFGPLLVGDLLEDYTMRLADPHGGLILLPVSPAKSRKERQKLSRSGDETTGLNTYVDKIKVANSVTEMLITHWRDVIRHMKSLSALKTMPSTKSLAVRGAKQQVLRPSASESFVLRRPPDWSEFRAPLTRRERSESPTPTQRPLDSTKALANKNSDTLVVRKQRSGVRPMLSQRLSGVRSMNILSPTLEEPPKGTISPANRRDKDTISQEDGLISNSEEDFEIPSKAAQLVTKSENLSFQWTPSEGDSHLYPAAIPRSSSPAPPNLPSSIHPPPVFARPSSPHYVKPVHQSMTSADLIAQTELESYQTQQKASALLEKSSNIQERSVPQFNNSKSSDARNLESPVTNLTVENAVALTDHPGLVLNSRGIIESYKHNTLQTGSLLAEPKSLPETNPPEIMSSVFKSNRAGIKFSQELSTIEAKSPRRTGGSEPGLQMKSPNKPDRRISKSLYEDPKRKRNLLDWSRLPFKRDPLLRVSQEEETASLATLAQAMNSADAKSNSPEAIYPPVMGSGEIPSSEIRNNKTKGFYALQTTEILRKDLPSSTRGGFTSMTASYLQENHSSKGDSIQNVAFSKVEHEAESKNSGFGNRSSTINEGSRVVRKETDYVPRSGSRSNAQPQTDTDRRTVASVQHRPVIPVQSSNSIEDSTKVKSTVLISKPSQKPVSLTFQNPSSPSKISALVARFNTASTSSKLLNNSPTKGPIKLVPSDGKEATESPGDSLLAPYTTNGPSPTRSQKSSKSERTLQTEQSPSPIEQTLQSNMDRDSDKVKNRTPFNDQSPKRLLRSSLNDPTPLRPIRRRLEMDGSPLAKVNPRSFRYSRPQPARKSSEVQAPDLVEKPQDGGGIKPVLEIEQQSSTSIRWSKPSNPKFRKSSFGSFKQPESEQSTFNRSERVKGSAYPDSESPRKISPRLDLLGSTFQTYFKPPKSFLNALEPARAASPVESLVDVPAFDGAGSVDLDVGNSSKYKGTSVKNAVPTSLGRSLMFDHNATGFVHPDSPFKDTFTSSNSESMFGSPPPRQESILSSQIKSMQLQMAQQAEQIRYLKRQVDILKTADVKRLGKELIKIREDVIIWRSRAEVAESKLEVLASTSPVDRPALGFIDRSPPYLQSSPLDSSNGADQHINGTQQASMGRDSIRNESNDYRVVTESARSSSTVVEDAEYSTRWSSEESSDTVFREVKRVPTDDVSSTGIK